VRKSNVLNMFCLILILLSFGCSNKKDAQKPLAGLSLLTSSDSFASEIAQTFEKTMSAYGFRTQILFCDNSIETQQRQISNFIANNAKLIFVHCAGDGNDYCDVFTRARNNGSKVVAIARGLLNCTDVQSVGDSLLKGVAKAEMVSHFLDTAFPDATDGSVNVLLLERLTKTGYIMTSAGMKLLQEKYIRHFDYKNLDFQKYDIDVAITYIDNTGKEHVVEEPSGGLILDETGYAVLNPYYDSRVSLYSAGNKDIQTVLEGQEAIEEFIARPEGPTLHIVMAFSGDAAIGANQRLMRYVRDGKIQSKITQLAVFGSDDTEANRSLLLESASDESVFRGFVGYRSIAWEVETMLKMAIEQEERQVLELEVTKTSYDAEKKGIKQEKGSYDFLKKHYLFQNWV